MLLIIAFIVALVYVLLRWRASKKIKRQALDEFKQIQQRFNERQDSTQLAKDLSTLFRRICISYFPRKDCAALTSEQWLKFLDNTLSDDQQPFHEGIGRALITAPYAKNTDVDAPALLALCRRWINHLPNRSPKGSEI